MQCHNNLERFCLLLPCEGFMLHRERPEWWLLIQQTAVNVYVCAVGIFGLLPASTRWGVTVTRSQAWHPLSHIAHIRQLAGLQRGHSIQILPHPKHTHTKKNLWHPWACVIMWHKHDWGLFNSKGPNIKPLKTKTTQSNHKVVHLWILMCIIWL